MPNQQNSEFVEVNEGPEAEKDASSSDEGIVEG